MMFQTKHRLTGYRDGLGYCIARLWGRGGNCEDILVSAMLMYDSIETHESNIKAQQDIINDAENVIKENKAAIKVVQNAASTAYIVWREEAAAKKAKTG
jgi:hypothetical protein